LLTIPRRLTLGLVAKLFTAKFLRPSYDIGRSFTTVAGLAVENFSFRAEENQGRESSLLDIILLMKTRVLLHNIGGEGLMSREVNLDHDQILLRKVHKGWLRENSLVHLDTRSAPVGAGKID